MVGSTIVNDSPVGFIAVVYIINHQKIENLYYLVVITTGNNSLCFSPIYDRFGKSNFYVNPDFFADTYLAEKTHKL